MHISSSYAKILGEKLFRTWEIPRSGSKAKNGEREREKRKKRLNDGDNNGQATHGARKHAWRTQAAWAKNQKTKNAVLDPKKTFSYKTYEKNFVLLQKFALKSIFR